MSSTPGTDRPLAGRIALVTGASRGIGFAIARALTHGGARVAMLARTDAPLRAAAESLGDLAAAFPCDVADARRVAATTESIVATLGEPDILVNNAGLFTLAAVADTAVADFERALDVNLAAPFRLVRALLPRMLAAGRGDVVTIGSIADRAAYPENGAYAASKHGLRALHEVLRAETRGTGVRAILVSPGPVDTPLWDAVGPDGRKGFTPRAAMLDADAVADAVLWAVTRPRDVTVDELRLGRS